MPTPVAVLSGGTRGFELGMFKKGPIAQGFNFPLNTNYTWWNGVDILSTQYLIYTDKYTMGSSTLANTIPVAWSTPDLNDSSLLALINTLPPRVGLPGFTDLDAALNWMDGTGDFFLLKNGIENIVTTNLQLYYDAGLFTSYAGTGVSVSDLSGNNRTGTLTNGTDFISSGVAAFNFDGTDDQIRLTSQVLSGSDSFTVNCWIQADLSETGGTIFGNYPAGTLQIFYGSQFMGMWLNNNSTYVDNASSFYTTNPVMITAVRDGSVTYFYQNGILLKQGSSSASIGTTTDFRLGTNTSNGEQFRGKISITQVYNISLTQSQILQNYNAQKGRFGLPSPVTDGLVARLEAGNPTSYPGSGTIWYDISGNGNNFTLFNGASYDSTTKSMTFDGSDDYGRSTNFIDLTSATATTVQWLGKHDQAGSHFLWEHTPNWNSFPGGFGIVMDSNGSTFQQNSWHANWNGQSARNFVNSVQSSFDFFLQTHRLIPNNALGLQDWINTDLQTFVVGPGYPTGTSTEGNTNGFANDYTYLASRAGSGALLDGNIGVFLMYKKALTQPEIVQNYEYYRDIYGLSGVTKNGLVLWLDAGNNQSYPSQGTTWYDISGSVYDSTLINGPTYSPNDGGYFSFDGGDDNIILNNNSIPSTATTNKVTVCFWSYGVSETTADSIIEARDSANQRTLNVHLPWSNNVIYWDCGNDRLTYGLSSGESLGWHFWTFTKDPSTGVMGIFRDGVSLVSSGGFTGNINVTTSVKIGSYAVNTNYFVGRVAQCQIYNRVLTGTEITQNFNSGRGRYGV